MAAQSHESWLKHNWLWLVGGVVVAGGAVLLYSSEAKAAPVAAPPETVAVTLLADSQSVNVPARGSLGIYAPTGGAITALSEDNKPVAVASGSTKFVVPNVQAGGVLQIAWVDATGVQHTTNLTVSVV